MNKHTHFVSFALAFSLATISGCSSDDDPAQPSAGAGGAAAGAPAGGAPAAGAPAGGAPAAGAPAGGAPAAGAPAAGAPAAGAPAAGAPGTSGDPVQGKASYTSLGCSACHGANGSDGAIGPNISGSMAAGIGSWGEAGFIQALRTGVGKDGQMFCMTMAKYSATDVTDVQAKNIYAYLMSVPNDRVNRGTCP